MTPSKDSNPPSLISRSNQRTYWPINHWADARADWLNKKLAQGQWFNVRIPQHRLSQKNFIFFSMTNFSVQVFSNRRKISSIRFQPVITTRLFRQLGHHFHHLFLNELPAMAGAKLWHLVTFLLTASSITKVDVTPSLNGTWLMLLRLTYYWYVVATDMKNFNNIS